MTHISGDQGHYPKRTKKTKKKEKKSLWETIKHIGGKNIGEPG